MTEGNSTPLWMLAIYAVLILAPLLTPFCFRKWIDSHPKATPDQLEATYLKANWVLLGCLILGSLTLQSTSGMQVAVANLGLTLFAFVWIERERKNWVHQQAYQRGLHPTATPPHSESWSAGLRPLLFLGFCVLLVSKLHVFGLLVLFIGTPVWLRILFSSYVLAPSPLRTEIEGIFERAQVPVQTIRVIAGKKGAFSNALVCGLGFAPAPLGRTLFISESLFTKLEPEEVIAVLYHEAAHFKLHHIPKRIGHMVLAYGGALLAITVPVLAIEAIALRLGWMTAHLGFVLGLFAAFAGILVIHRRMFQVVQHQELEADAYAVKLGGQAEALIRALQKLTQDHGGFYQKKQGFLNRWLLGRAHPSLEEREISIRQGTHPAREPWVQDPKTWVVAYSTLLIIIGVFLKDELRTPEDPSKSRQPASISDPK